MSTQADGGNGAAARRGQVYDVVVVGGGAAGLAGAATLGRALRSVLVVDAGQPRNAPADGVHTYLGHEGTPPAELLARGRAEVRGYGGDVVDGAVVAVTRRHAGDHERVSENGQAAGIESVAVAEDASDVADTSRASDVDGAFDVVLADGGSVRARRVLVATGLVDELPDIPGLAELWGRYVLHCPYCHGWEVRGQPLGVVATGPFGVHQALLWRQWSDDVTLFLHAAPEPTESEREQLAARGIAVVAGKVAALESTGGALSAVRMVDGSVHPRRAVAVATRLSARAEMLDALGLRPVDQFMGEHVIGSAVPADPTGATAVPGVWVAGNVADVVGQVVSSAAAGVRAAAAINADLIAEDTRHAVAAYHRA